LHPRPAARLTLTLLAALALSACSGNDWTGEWTVKAVRTPLTGASTNPLREAMLGERVKLTRSEVVLPHYTRETGRLTIPIERVEPANEAGEVVLHPAEGSRHVDASLIVTPRADGTVVLHGVPRDGPSANFFLTLERR
jgi:hypothetical protein